MTLHLIIFVAALTLLDDINSPSVTYDLVLLPLLMFFRMTLLLHKVELKKVITHFTLTDELPNSTTVNNNNEVPMREFHHIVDDNARKKVTVTHVK